MPARVGARRDGEEKGGEAAALTGCRPSRRSVPQLSPTTVAARSPKDTASEERAPPAALRTRQRRLPATRPQVECGQGYGAAPTAQRPQERLPVHNTLFRGPRSSKNYPKNSNPAEVKHRCFQLKSRSQAARGLLSTAQEVSLIYKHFCVLGLGHLISLHTHPYRNDTETKLPFRMPL